MTIAMMTQSPSTRMATTTWQAFQSFEQAARLSKLLHMQPVMSIKHSVCNTMNKKLPTWV